MTLLNSHLINTIVNDVVDEDECLSQIPDLLKKDCLWFFCEINDNNDDVVIALVRFVLGFFFCNS